MLVVVADREGNDWKRLSYTQNVVSAADAKPSTIIWRAASGAGAHVVMYTYVQKAKDFRIPRRPLINPLGTFDVYPTATSVVSVINISVSRSPSVRARRRHLFHPSYHSSLIVAATRPANRVIIRHRPPMRTHLSSLVSSFLPSIWERNFD